MNAKEVLLGRREPVGREREKVRVICTMEMS
jgi:hypothetical protein